MSHDEHADWLKFHKGAFIAFTCVCGWFGMYICFMYPDWYAIFRFSVLHMVMNELEALRATGIL